MRLRPGLVPQWPSSRGFTSRRHERSPQQRVVEEIDLTDREVVRGAPVGVEVRELVVGERLVR